MRVKHERTDRGQGRLSPKPACFKTPDTGFYQILTVLTVTPTTRRGLSTLLAAEFVNFSAQIQADKNKTLEELRMLRGEVLEPLVGDYHGSIEKWNGYGWLVKFRSVSDAELRSLDS